MSALEELSGEEQIRAIVRLVGHTYQTHRGVARSAALHYWNCTVERRSLQAERYRRRRLRPSPATLNTARALGAGMTAVNVAGVLAVSNTSVPPVVSKGGPASH